MVAPLLSIHVDMKCRNVEIVTIFSVFFTSFRSSGSNLKRPTEKEGQQTAPKWETGSLKASQT